MGHPLGGWDESGTNFHHINWRNISNGECELFYEEYKPLSIHEESGFVF